MRCPTDCPCVCHDTGGWSPDHPNGPCPGKPYREHARSLAEAARFVVQRYEHLPWVPYLRAALEEYDDALSELHPLAAELRPQLDEGSIAVAIDDDE